MGDLPLRTPIHRRFGGPLPRQLPNAARARLVPLLLKFWSCDQKVPWDVSPRFRGLSPGTRLVAHVLLTRAPVAIKVLLPVLPLDLHVLSLSLAFILSQDQTLHCKILFRNLYLAGSCV